jgi:biotin operon repressor
MYDAPEPVLDVNDNWFSIVFPRFKKYQGKNIEHSIGDSIGDNQRKILDEIFKDPFVSSRKLAEKIEISQRNIEPNIKKLREKGIMHRVGPANGGHRVVNKKSDT